MKKNISKIKFKSIKKSFCGVYRTIFKRGLNLNFNNFLNFRDGKIFNISGFSKSLNLYEATSLFAAISINGVKFARNFALNLKSLSQNTQNLAQIYQNRFAERKIASLKGLLNV